MTASSKLSAKFLPLAAHFYAIPLTPFNTSLSARVDNDRVHNDILMYFQLNRNLSYIILLHLPVAIEAINIQPIWLTGHVMDTYSTPFDEWLFHTL